ncbi:porphobilinogen deaminase, dipyromethane cofactor binding domain protein [Mycobacterium xenopi 3993]|nr:porphobilinogen deaminase, dipyromethane cofactor binding domain protein [Mycobacterium xenopi 3993]
MIRIGTRASRLATTQAGSVRDALVARGHPAELVTITTEGDRSSAPIATIGVGVFTTALREAIAEGRVDAAVHSHKDLPTANDPRFVVAAIPRREDPATWWWPRRVTAGGVAARLGSGYLIPATGRTA